MFHIYFKDNKNGALIREKSDLVLMLLLLKWNGFIIIGILLFFSLLILIEFLILRMCVRFLFPFSDYLLFAAECSCKFLQSL